MQQLSLKRISILGFILMVASAVTATILPSNKKTELNKRAAGEIVVSSDGGGLTCRNGGAGVDCDYTATGTGGASGSNEILGGTNTGTTGGGTTMLT